LKGRDNLRNLGVDGSITLTLRCQNVD